MDETQRAAFLIAQAACMAAELAAMQERNRVDIIAGRGVTHGPADMEGLVDKYGLGHNTAVTWLLGGAE